MKRVLIIGGTSALGKATQTTFQQSKEFDVYISGRSIQEEDSFRIKLEATNSSELIKCIERIKPDFIFQMAASYDDELNKAYPVNVGIAQNILEYLKNEKLSTKLILIGSAAEYGIVNSEENPISEERVLKPVSIYGLTKAWQSQLVSLYATQGVNVSYARVFNLYGELISDRLFAGKIQNQINDFINGKSNSINVSSLDATRDYISTEEAAIQLKHIALYGTPGEIYNVGSGQPVKMRNFLMSLLTKHNISPKLVNETPSKNSNIQVPIIYADTTKFKKLVSF